MYRARFSMAVFSSGEMRFLRKTGNPKWLTMKPAPHAVVPVPLPSSRPSDGCVKGQKHPFSVLRKFAVDIEEIVVAGEVADDEFGGSLQFLDEGSHFRDQAIQALQAEIAPLPCLVKGRVLQDSEIQGPYADETGIDPVRTSPWPGHVISTGMCRPSRA